MPSISIARNTFAPPTISARLNTGPGRRICRRASTHITTYVTSGIDFPRARRIGRRENPFCFSRIMPATLKLPPRQIAPLPTSNRLVVITPAGPRNPWANGSTKLLIFTPEVLITAKACASLPLRRLIRQPIPIRMIPYRNPTRIRISSDSSSSLPDRFVMIAAGSVMLITIRLSR